MMLVPRRDFDMFDDFFKDDFFKPRTTPLMKSDIREKEDKYLIDMDLPGCSKENIDISLKDGYLNISATLTNEVNEEEEHFVRRERYTGECSRRFYVGEEVTEEDISAEFKDGILKIEVPKKEKKTIEAKKIEIK